MTFPNLLYGAAFWFVLTMLSSFIGDDDIVYNCMSMNRPPTGKETLARMRFVFPKLFASLYCGGLLAMLFTQNILRGVFSLNPPRLQIIGLIAVGWVLCGLFIGVIQNWMRPFQGRQQRPILDMPVWRYGINLWKQTVVK